LQHLAATSQNDLTVVLENVHDPHNIGAVARSCDAVGVREIYIINTDPRVQNREKYIGDKSSSGSKKWISFQYFEEIEPAIKAIRAKYKKIYSTHLTTASSSLYDLDLSDSCALIFGNEHAGISKQLLEHADANFIIPQMGMVESLNISVACAVSLFEALRQRIEADKYDLVFDESNAKHQENLDKIFTVHHQAYRK
jgi:tRNA (guanosine-2'-O-)-methyltransferase